MRSIILVVLAVISTSAHSQNVDSMAIRTTMLDYVEGYYNGDWQRVSKAVHSELVKRIIITDSSGLAAINNQGASTLILGAKRRKKENGEPFKAESTFMISSRMSRWPRSLPINSSLSIMRSWQK